MTSADDSAASFYVAQPDTTDEFLPTPYCVGPWSSQLQHGGPPSALLTRSLEAAAISAGVPWIARLTVQLLRPVPMSALKVATQVASGGKRVGYIGGTLTAGGAVVATATAVCMRRSETPDYDARSLAQPAACPMPPRGAKFEFPLAFVKATGSSFGYGRAFDMELAANSGPYGKGATTIWFKQRVPLVLNEAPTGLQRLLTVADSGNGISFFVPPFEASFANPDLSVVLHRPPVGEWICMAARTDLNAYGSGVASSKLFDAAGHCADGSQTLFVNKL